MGELVAILAVSALWVGGCAAETVEAVAAPVGPSAEASVKPEEFPLEVGAGEPAPPDAQDDAIDPDFALWTEPGVGCASKTDCAELAGLLMEGQRVHEAWGSMCGGDNLGENPYCDLSELAGMCLYADSTRHLYWDCSLEMYWDFGMDTIAFFETADRIVEPESDPRRYHAVLDGCEGDGRSGKVWGRIVNGDVEPHSYLITAKSQWVRQGYSPLPAAFANVFVSNVEPGQTVQWSGWLGGVGFEFNGERSIGNCNLTGVSVQR